MALHDDDDDDENNDDNNGDDDGDDDNNNEHRKNSRDIRYSNKSCLPYPKRAILPPQKRFNPVFSGPTGRDGCQCHHLPTCDLVSEIMGSSYPIGSMYGIFTYTFS